MNSAPARRPVVVATDGSASALRGVRYAALEASGLGTALDIVHVIPAYVPGIRLPTVPDAALQSFGRSVLEESAATALRTAGHLDVLTSLVSGSQVTELVKAAWTASALVLGARGHSSGGRLATSATVNGAAARSRCPVVLVPEAWQGANPVSMRRVLVGYKSAEHAPGLLARAFWLASERGAALRILHAWKLPTGYDDVVADVERADVWGHTLRSQIEEQVVDLRACYPEVAVDIEVDHARAADALVAASCHADRVLIGRPTHGGRIHHLGAVARTVLRECGRPVEIVPPGRYRDAFDLRAHGAGQRATV